MKKLLLIAAVVVGGVAASQAGVRLNIGIGLPFPPPPPVVIGHPAPYYEPQCAPPVVQYPCPPPVVVRPPVCPPRVVVCPPPRVHYRKHAGYNRGYRYDDRRYYSYNGRGDSGYGRGDYRR